MVKYLDKLKKNIGLNITSNIIKSVLKQKLNANVVGANKTPQFRTQKHQNYIKQQQLLADHNIMMNNIDQIIIKRSKYLEQPFLTSTVKKCRIKIHSTGHSN
jgi:hypothetical protein